MIITYPLVIHVDIHTLYQNFVESIADMIWEDVDILKNNDFMADFKVLSSEDVEGIRGLFQSGNTMMLLGESHMKTVEDNSHDENDVTDVMPGIEIRLYNRKGNCTGVILNNEINY